MEQITVVLGLLAGTCRSGGCNRSCGSFRARCFAALDYHWLWLGVAPPIRAEFVTVSAERAVGNVASVASAFHAVQTLAPKPKKFSLMILLAESTALLPPSSSRDDIARSLQAARLTGWRVFEIPPDFQLCDNAENALAYVPRQLNPTPTVWLGYIPDSARYEAIHQAALQKNLRLLNTPEEHQLVQEFDATYPFLEGKTPRSIVVHSTEEALERAPEIGFPLFLKGAVQSRKSRGLSACVANNPTELEARVRELLELELRSRGRVVLRELVQLRHITTHGDFPMGREFRVFLLDAQILALGYYWPHADELALLTEDERRQIERLCVEAARRIPARFLSLDCGQLESGAWTIIEAGDPQFSGLSQIAPLAYWNRLRTHLQNENELPSD